MVVVGVQQEKESSKSLETKRLATRPQKDHKDGQTPKGKLDAAHPPNPQSRASTAKGSEEHLCCNGIQGHELLPHTLEKGSSTDRAPPCASDGVESLWPPQGALQRQSAPVTGGLQSAHEMPTPISRRS